MRFDDDLPVFLADFGVIATVSGLSNKVLFNKPDSSIFNEGQVTGDYQIRYITNQFPDLHDGVVIMVNGLNYRVKGEPVANSDGSFSMAGLKK